jgi:hypothetical protein
VVQMWGVQGLVMTAEGRGRLHYQRCMGVQGRLQGIASLHSRIVSACEFSLFCAVDTVNDLAACGAQLFGV